MPPLGFLFDGLLPMFILPYSSTGVACTMQTIVRLLLGSAIITQARVQNTLSVEKHNPERKRQNFKICGSWYFFRNISPIFYTPNMNPNGMEHESDTKNR